MYWCEAKAAVAVVSVSICTNNTREVTTSHKPIHTRRHTCKLSLLLNGVAKTMLLLSPLLQLWQRAEKVVSRKMMRFLWWRLVAAVDIVVEVVIMCHLPKMFTRPHLLQSPIAVTTSKVFMCISVCVNVLVFVRVYMCKSV